MRISEIAENQISGARDFKIFGKTTFSEKLLFFRKQSLPAPLFFIGSNPPKTDLLFTWYMRVLPLLAEYFYNDGERLSATIGSRFVRPIKLNENTRRALGNLLDAEIVKFEIVVLEDDELVQALTELTE